VQEINMTKTITGDVAMLRNLLASRTSDRKVPAAVTNIREALGIGVDGFPIVREVRGEYDSVAVLKLAQGERDADVAEEIFGTADEITSHEGVVTKLPEVHDPEGDDLPYHVPAGRATQVMGTREIDISRYPNDLDPLVTDTRRRALPARSAIARAKELEDILAGDEKLQKLMRKWDVKRFSVRLSR
jgi:hypothetical protein